MRQYKILVSVLAYDKGKSGIADYTNNVIEFLSKDHKLDLLIYEKDSHIFPIKNENINLLKVSDKFSNAIISMAYHLFVLPLTLPFHRYDFVFLPAGNRRLFAFYPKKTIVTFHDLSQFHIDGKYDSFRMFYIKKVIPFFLKKAQLIMAISNSTKLDMQRYYKLPEDRIEVNYNGYSPAKLKALVSKEQLINEYNLKGDFILYISRIEHPGKNHLNLIKAYETLAPSLKEKYQLVFGGSEWNGAEEVMNYAKNSPDKENIIFLGFVPDNHLGALYKNASLYAFPSFYEGFGIPLLEAMHCSTPVICSNVSSLPEVGGDAILTFNPNSVEEIAESIQKVLNDKELQKIMIDKGLEQVSKFSWEKHVLKIIELAK